MDKQQVEKHINDMIFGWEQKGHEEKSIIRKNLIRLVYEYEAIAGHVAADLRNMIPYVPKGLKGLVEDHMSEQDKRFNPVAGGHRIIFLDIDGVLNCKKWFTDPAASGQVARPLVTKYNRIVKETKAKVVLSSSWRKGITLEKMDSSIMLSYQINGELVGATDVWHYANMEYYHNVCRGAEIAHWLWRHNRAVGDWPGIESYVILDDQMDMLLEQSNHFVHVDWEIGLSDNNVQQAIEILNRFK